MVCFDIINNHLQMTNNVTNKSLASHYMSYFRLSSDITALWIDGEMELISTRHHLPTSESRKIEGIRYYGYFSQIPLIFVYIKICLLQ
jgi:hypothetical protein